MADSLTIEQAMDAVYQQFGADCLELDAASGEFTATQYARRHDIKYNSAVRQLIQAEQAGRVTRRDAKHNGHKCWAYRIVTSP